MTHPRIPVLAVAVAGFAFLVPIGCGEDEVGTLPTAPYFDYGTLELGTTKTHVFEIPIPDHDLGDVAPEAFHGDCACAVPLLMIRDEHSITRAVYGLPLDQRILKPSDTVILRLKLDTRQKEAVDIDRTLSRGFIKFLHISGELRRTSTVMVTFHYGIRTPVKLTPVTHIDFGDLPRSGSYRQTLELRNNIPGQQLSLGAVHASPSCIEARLERQEDKVLLHVTITPDEARPIYGKIAVATGLDHYPDVEIPVSGTFIPDIQFEPSHTISYDIFDFATEKEHFVNIIDHDRKRPVGFVTHSLTNPNGKDILKHFDVQFQPLSGRKIRVTVKYLGTMGGMRMRGELKLAKTAGGKPVAFITLIGHNKTR